MKVLVDLVPRSLINIFKNYHAKFQKRIASFISFFICLLLLFFYLYFIFFISMFIRFFCLIFHINFFINVIYTHIFSLFLHFVRQFPYGAMVLFKKKTFNREQERKRIFDVAGASQVNESTTVDELMNYRKCFALISERA